MYDDPEAYGFEVNEYGILRSRAKLFYNTIHEVVGLWQIREHEDLSNPYLDIDNVIGPMIE